MSCFAPSQINLNNNNLKLKNGYRIFSNKDLVIKSNCDFLNMNNDFLLYSYLFKKLNNKINKLDVSSKLLSVDISFKEMIEIFNIPKFLNKDHKEAFHNIFLRLKEVVLDIRLKNEKEGLITGLINDVYYKEGKNSQTTYTVEFSSNLYRALNQSSKIFNRNIVFDLNDHKKFKKDGTIKKIALYLNSLSEDDDGFRINKIKTETFQYMLNHKQLYLIDDQVVEKTREDKREKKTKKPLNSNSKSRKKTFDELSLRDIKAKMKKLVESEKIIKDFKLENDNQLFVFDYINQPKKSMNSLIKDTENAVIADFEYFENIAIENSYDDDELIKLESDLKSHYSKRIFPKWVYEEAEIIEEYKRVTAILNSKDISLISKLKTYNGSYFPPFN